MGIANVTPDSFYPGSRIDIESDGTKIIDRLIAQGPDIIDIGGESSRPGSLYITGKEEINRIAPILGYIRKHSAIRISVDTRKASVARFCLDEGADIVNDISALEDDPEMAELVAQRHCDVVLMHKQGNPDTMQKNPRYVNTVEDVLEYLCSRVDYACSCGIRKEHIIVDPGIGFGKTTADNVLLLKNLFRFRETGCRVLVGLSRKSVVGSILEIPVEERLPGTLVANTFACLNGADIIRVHDVSEHCQMKKILSVIAGLEVAHGSV